MVQISPQPCVHKRVFSSQLQPCICSNNKNIPYSIFVRISLRSCYVKCFEHLKSMIIIPILLLSGRCHNFPLIAIVKSWFPPVLMLFTLSTVFASRHQSSVDSLLLFSVYNFMHFFQVSPPHFHLRYLPFFCELIKGS